MYETKNVDLETVFKRVLSSKKDHALEPFQATIRHPKALNHNITHVIEGISEDGRVVQTVLYNWVTNEVIDWNYDDTNY